MFGAYSRQVPFAVLRKKDVKIFFEERFTQNVDIATSLKSCRDWGALVKLSRSNGSSSWCDMQTTYKWTFQVYAPPSEKQRCFYSGFVLGTLAFFCSFITFNTPCEFYGGINSARDLPT